MTEEETRKYTAIMRIGYLLAAADGTVKPDEREAFKKTLKSIGCFTFGDQASTDFIEDVVECGNKFALLHDFYSEDEMIRAFMGKVAKDVVTLRDDKRFLRRAFTVWTSICLADKEYSAFEKKLVKALQNAFNGISGASTEALSAVGLLGGITALFGNMATSPEAAHTEATLISDDFLSEIRSRCTAIDEIQSQIDDCKYEDAKASLNESLGYLVDSIKEFVDNIEA